MKTTCLIFTLFMIPRCLFAQPERCTEPVEMTSFCADACIICDIDGFEGRHESTIVGESPPNFAGECTNISHNLQWIAFIAGSENLKVSLLVVECNLGRGLEFGLYKGINCGNYVRISNCFGGGSNNSIKPGSSGVIENTEPLVIGQYYYIVMDGAAGDNCNWFFDVLEGETRLDPMESSGTIIGDSIFCPNSEIVYEVAAPIGATEFRWTLNGKVVDRNESAPTVAVEFKEAGRFILCVTASNACQKAPPTCKEIEVISIPPTIIEGNICDGDSFEVADTILIETGFYEFNKPTLEGCDSLILVDLEVIPEMLTDLGQINICIGDTLPLGEEMYVNEGRYERKLFNSLGCDSTVSFDLFLVECEIQGQATSQEVSCFGESSGSFSFEVSNGTPPFSYQWETLEGTLNGSETINDLNEIQVVQNIPIGTYLITVSDEFGNQTILIEEVTEPPKLATAIEVSSYGNYEISCFESKDGILKLITEGGTKPYTYLWKDNSQDSERQSLAAGTYMITITDSQNCNLLETVTLKQPAPLNINFVSSVPDCEDAFSGKITDVTTSGGVAPYQYKLDNSDFGNLDLFDDLAAGIYDLNVMDANGCTHAASIQLDNPLIPIIDLGEDITINLGEEIMLIPANEQDLNLIEWKSDPFLSCYDCLTPIASPVTESTFYVTASSIDNCFAKDSITVKVLIKREVYVPNAFSPNGDGVNDHFIIHTGQEVTVIQTLAIYSRWGDKVFEQHGFVPNSTNFSWDGTFKNQNLDNGIYIWVTSISFIDGETLTYSGNIALIR